MTIIKLSVNQIVENEGVLCYEVMYKAQKFFFKLFKHEIDNPTFRKSEIECIDYGTDESGAINLKRDRKQIIKEIYEEGKVYIFRFGSTKFDDETLKRYYVLYDDYNFAHRIYEELPEEMKVNNADVPIFVKKVDPDGRYIAITLSRKPIRSARPWFDADTLFNQIGFADQKKLFFDDYINNTRNDNSPKIANLRDQYNNKNNLWIFTYVYILENYVKASFMNKRDFNNAIIVCRLIIKIQEWIAEGSDYLKYFSPEQVQTATKHTSDIIKEQEETISAIYLINSDQHDAAIRDVINIWKTRGRIAIRREERINTLTNLLQILPDYFVNEPELAWDVAQFACAERLDIASLRTLYFAFRRSANIILRSLNRHSFLKTNDFDTSDQKKILNILQLLQCAVKINYWQYTDFDNDLTQNIFNLRAVRAAFYRILSLIAPNNLKEKILNIAIRSLIGNVNDQSIFVYGEPASHLDVNHLSILASNITFVQPNDNGKNSVFFSHKFRSGLITFNNSGFTILPYCQCYEEYSSSTHFLSKIEAIHHHPTLPICLGSMNNPQTIDFNVPAKKQCQIWRDITQSKPERNDRRKRPQFDDEVLITVSRVDQSTPKTYVFVSSSDPEYAHVEGILPASNVSERRIDDMRTLFNEGDKFYATVVGMKDGKYQFSIREIIDDPRGRTDHLYLDIKAAAEIEDDWHYFSFMSESFINELMLIIDCQINITSDTDKRLLLIGYAQCISSIIGHSKSYEYNALIEMHSSIEEYLESGSKIDFSFIKPSSDAAPLSANLAGMQNILKLLNSMQSGSDSDISMLNEQLINSDCPEHSRLINLLLAFIYIKRADVDNALLTEIREAIKTQTTSMLTSLDMKSFASNTEPVDSDEDDKESDPAQTATSYITEDITNTLNENDEITEF